MFISLPRSALAWLPLVAFLSTLFLSTVPGAVLSRWVFDERLAGRAMEPVSYAICAGVFGLLAVPFLILPAALSAGLSS